MNHIGHKIKELRRKNDLTQEKLAKKLDSITEAKWEMIPLHVEFQGARVIKAE